jgi:predicted unusual protein kinase regulating ubiquinone biosynthesis (AarF/ABC1/UbiB family)
MRSGDVTEGRAVPQGRLRRSLPLTGFTARAAGGHVVATLRERAGDSGAVQRHRERTAQRYADLLGHSKGLLMKAGQLFSMVDTGDADGAGGALSPYQRALSRLQSNAPPMHPDLARDTVESELGRPLEQVFAEFSPDPIAAASIGQVHRATLHDGRAVAVKVQYPGVAEAIRDDLANTELVSAALRLMSAVSGASTDLQAATAEIAERIGEELDYRLEAAHCTAFGELYRDHPFIEIPEVIPGASTERVLTMTYLDGLDWAAARTADQRLKDRWAEVVVRMVTGSYRHADLFHADPHPGNFRFRPDGRVGFVDFGCVKRLPEVRRRQMVMMLRATIEDRRADLHTLMAEAGFFGRGTLTADEAYQWWASMAAELTETGPVTFDPADIDRTARSLIDVRAADHPVRRMTIPRDYIFFSRVSLALSSILGSLHATLDARAIIDELDGVGGPATEIGVAHDRWVRERGLPFGLDRRG